MNTIQEKEIREERIRRICTYYSELGEGTAGYSLSEKQFKELFKYFDTCLQQIEEEAYKKMSNRNVAICSKCNSLFKAKHENCLSLQGEGGGK